MARDFDGNAANNLNITDPPGGLDITGTVMTVSAWIRPDTLVSFGRIATKWSGSAGQYLFSLGNAGQILFRISGSSDSAVGPTVLSTGVWQHVAGRKNGNGASNISVHLNGVVNGTGSSVNPIPDTANNFRVGADMAGAIGFDGRIAEVALWNVALSDAEIAALATGANPLRVHPNNLAAYYPLWGVGAGGEPDLSGNGQTLTEVGTVGVADHAPVGPYVLL